MDQSHSVDSKKTSSGQIESLRKVIEDESESDLLRM